MNVKIKFEELANFVESVYLVRPQFLHVDNKTFEVTCKPGIFLPPMTIKLTIEAVRKDVVCMSYVCSQAVSVLIANTLEYFGDNKPHGFEVQTDDKRINLYLEHIDKIEKVVEHVQLSGIEIHEGEVELTATLL